VEAVDCWIQRAQRLPQQRVAEEKEMYNEMRWARAPGRAVPDALLPVIASWANVGAEQRSDIAKRVGAVDSWIRRAQRLPQQRVAEEKEMYNEMRVWRRWACAPGTDASDALLPVIARWANVGAEQKREVLSEVAASSAAALAPDSHSVLRSDLVARVGAVDSWIKRAQRLPQQRVAEERELYDEILCLRRWARDPARSVTDALLPVITSWADVGAGQRSEADFRRLAKWIEERQAQRHDLL